VGYKDITNPYDFANPVTEEKLFAGRIEQLAEIKYYLMHGVKSKKPINLSLIGDRAAGKTSLLNMIEIEANKLDYLTVRIDLDEGDVTSQLHFFFKIFDSILNAAFDKEFFGGHGGAVFDEYLNQTSSYAIAKDTAFRPFLFPIQYAKAMDANRDDIIISEINFKRDLDKIEEEVGRSILLLFDECNVLSGSRVLLEKVRNIFMNKTSYMLVLTGTKKLFPLIDDIFSPIVRQFKKIQVDEYKELKETELCVNKPLLDVGLDPREIFDYSTYNELHSISEGKPYEIQLICHNMFKKMQESDIDAMELDHSVLEDVRLELETSQDLAKRPRLYDVKSLDKAELVYLNYICKSLECEGPDEILNLEYIVHGNARVDQRILKATLDKFVERGIIYCDASTNNLFFFGDDFDKLYTKYYARERGVKFEFNYLPLFYNYFDGIRDALAISSCFYDISSHKHSASLRTLSYFMDDSKVVDPASFNLNVYKAIYGLENSEAQHLQIQIKVGTLILSMSFFAAEKDVARFQEFVHGLQARMLGLKTVVVFVRSEVMKIKIPSREILDERVRKLSQLEVVEDLIEFHETYYTLAYYQGDKYQALRHCLSIYDLDLKGDKHFCLENSYNVQNLGYIFLVNDILDKAEECFCSQSDSASDLHKALCNYNKGILALKKGDKPSCLNSMRTAVSLINNCNASDRASIACLIVPEFMGEGDQIVYSEIMKEMDLAETALRIIGFIE